MAMYARPWYFRERLYTAVTGESRTQQSHADGSDVNVIVQRYQRTGQLPPNPRGLEPQFMDCTPFAEDLTSAYNNAVQVTDDAQAQLKAYYESQSGEGEGASPQSTSPPEDPAPSSEADPPATE